MSEENKNEIEKKEDQSADQPNLRQLIDLTEGLKRLSFLAGIGALLIGFWVVVAKIFVIVRENYL